MDIMYLLPEGRRALSASFRRGEGNIDFLQLTFCTSFRRGEGHYVPTSGGEKGILSSYSGHSLTPSGGENCIMCLLPEGRMPYSAPTVDKLYLLRRGEKGIMCLHPERRRAY